MEAGPFYKPRVPRWGFPAGSLRVGYVWESVVPRHAPPLEQQMEAVQDCHKIFHEKITVESGDVSLRTQFKEMLNFLQEGDTVVVHNLGCLGKSANEAIGFAIHLLKPHKCNLQIPHLIDTTDPDTFNTVFAMLEMLMWADIQEDVVERYIEGFEVAGVRETA
jgi:DNA invertase Pin-like site-specific DNA recombinase